METIDTTKLPQNLEAEQALLGAILANNKAIEKVSEFLKPQHFADSVHAKIFEVISTLIQRGHIADVITLKNYFELEGTLNEVGGPNYLIKLADSSSPMTNVEYYGRFIEGDGELFSPLGSKHKYIYLVPEKQAWETVNTVLRNKKE